jgi:hypothetical protein
MLPEIHQHVHDGVAGLARRGQRAGVVAVSPHGAIASERVVDCAGRADGEAPRSAGQRPLILGLHQEMQVVALDREVHDPEVGTAGRANAFAQPLEQARSPQRGKPSSGSEGEVDRVRRLVFRPGSVRDGPASPWNRRPASALSTSAPPGGLCERELLLCSHLNRANSGSGARKCKAFQLKRLGAWELPDRSAAVSGMPPVAQTHGVQPGAVAP